MTSKSWLVIMSVGFDALNALIASVTISGFTVGKSFLKAASSAEA